VLVTGAVVAHRRLGHRLLNGSERDLGGGVVPADTPQILGHAGRGFQSGQGPPGVTTADPHQMLAGLLPQGVCRGQPALGRHRRLDHLANVVVGQRCQRDQHRP
jgi:hypothetical protein